MSLDSSDEIPSDDLLNILIASDIHLGCAEKDAIKGDDSYITFEEILSIAKEKNVDFILLGGDLFHESKPSPKCIHRCMTLIRKYCMGDRPINVEFLSDQAENFKHCVNPVVNYEDPNVNISLPIFSIHGNHDDPSGYGHLSSLDILSVSGLVNYFGKWTDLTQVEISPLLMRKGATHFALYGLSYLKDERLARLFKNYNVKMFRPREDPNKWFNVFMLHQNRVDRGPNNFIEEEMLPDFLDLVIWGHEHECRIKPEWNEKRKFYVCQPGSPVATSLCEGEAVPKHVAILSVYKKNLKITPIRLKTVRPFVFDSIALADCTLDESIIHLHHQAQYYVTDHIITMMDRAAQQISGDSRQPDLPLVRLRVEYTDERYMFNGVRFGLQYTNKVANPSEMILFRKQRIVKDKKNSDGNIDKEALENMLSTERLGSLERNVETIVERYFAEEAPNQYLQILSIKGLAEAAARFITKHDNCALTDIVDHQMEKTIAHLMRKCEREEDIDQEIENFRLQRQEKSEEESKDACKFLDNPSRGKARYKAQLPEDNIEDSDSDGINGGGFDVAFESTSRGARGRGRAARGRGSRGTSPRARGGTRGRGKKEPVVQTSIKDVFSSSSSRPQRSSATTSKGRKVVIFDDDSDD